MILQKSFIPLKNCITAMLFIVKKTLLLQNVNDVMGHHLIEAIYF